MCIHVHTYFDASFWNISEMHFRTKKHIHITRSQIIIVTSIFYQIAPYITATEPIHKLVVVVVVHIYFISRVRKIQYTETGYDLDREHNPAHVYTSVYAGVDVLKV